jgi:hypothetical protein
MPYAIDHHQCNADISSTRMPSSSTSGPDLLLISLIDVQQYSRGGSNTSQEELQDDRHMFGDDNSDSSVTPTPQGNGKTMILFPGASQ